MENFKASFYFISSILLFTMATKANAATYYVSSEGRDSNSGLSEQEAFLSIQRVNQLELLAGDRVLFRGGEQFTGELVITAQQQDNSTAPITIGSFGEGRATLNPGSGTGVYIENIGGVRIENLNIKSTDQSQSYGQGILFYNFLENSTKLRHIRIENVDVSGFETGILIYAEAADFTQSGYDDVLINNVRAFSNTYAGIAVDGIEENGTDDMPNSNVRITNSVVFDNFDSDMTQAHYDQPGNGILIGGTKGGLISGNTAYNNATKEQYLENSNIDFAVVNSIEVVVEKNQSYGSESKDQSQESESKDVSVDLPAESLSFSLIPEGSLLLKDNSHISPSLFYPDGYLDRMY